MTIQHCTNCLMPSTRPRITFNQDGVCNACAWAEEKKTSVDWSARWQELEQMAEKFRSQDKFDVIVPVSGGKDSCYVAWNLKHKLGLHPLCVNVQPPLAYQIGTENLENFIQHGYDTIRVYPNPEIARQIAKRGLVEHGQPLMAWITAVQVAIFRIAIQFEIPLIMFGEEGETEYGGSSKLKYTPFYTVDFSRDIYLSGIDPDRYLEHYTRPELVWWLYPAREEFERANLHIAHWSYFENWDPYHNYLVAKDKFGLKERKEASISTYNNFASTDCSMFDLHTYFMYLKFGFGRCTNDVGIDIRRGALDRAQGKFLVEKIDGQFPEPYLEEYLKYFQMSREEFQAVIDKWANKDLLKKQGHHWVRNFSIP